jgi:short subunit dehydrogenase-like uncharacterized protein
MGQRPIVIYAATGYTGRLIAAELLARGERVVLAGRSADKLRALRDRLGAGVAGIVGAGLDDATGLRTAAAQGTVIVNCAGPFSASGDAVIGAAIAEGAHYLDTTGEQDWIRRVFEHHDAGLRAAGVAAVPGMAFSHTPGDLLAHLVGRAVAPAKTIMIAYHVEGFDMTRGTMHSSLEQMNGLDVAYEDGAWIPEGRRPRRAFVTFPAPIGRRLVARYPTGEVVSVPRHVATREVVARISTESIAPAPVAPLVPAITPALGRLLRSRVKPLLDRAIDRLPEGPAEEDRRRARGVVSGPDIYGLTAKTIAQAAIELSDPAFARSGALGPAQAVDATAFLDGLAAFGVRWSVDAPAAAGVGVAA